MTAYNDAEMTDCGCQEKTPAVLGSAVTRNHWLAVSPNVSSRVTLGIPP